MANLTDEQRSALQSVQKSFDDPSDFADALKSEAHSYFQEPFNRGHSTAAGQKSEDIDELQEQVASLQSELQQKEDQIQTLKDEDSDVEAAVESFRESEYDPLKEEHQQLKSRLAEKAKQEGRQKVQSRLADELGDEFLAESLVNAHLDGHIGVSDDFEPQFLQDPDNGVPVQADDPADALATDLLEQVPDKYKPSQEQGGQRADSSRSMQGATSQGMTKADTDLGEFASQYDGTPEEAAQAYQQLPDS